MQFKYSGVSHIIHKQTSNADANEQINVQHKILMQKDENTNAYMPLLLKIKFIPWLVFLKLSFS